MLVRILQKFWFWIQSAGRCLAAEADRSEATPTASGGHALFDTALSLSAVVPLGGALPHLSSPFYVKQRIGSAHHCWTSGFLCVPTNMALMKHGQFKLVSAERCAMFVGGDLLSYVPGPPCFASRRYPSG